MLDGNCPYYFLNALAFRFVFFPVLPLVVFTAVVRCFASAFQKSVAHGFLVRSFHFFGDEIRTKIGRIVSISKTE